jgi:hypothetical protein
MDRSNKETVAYRHKLVDEYKISVGCCLCSYNKHPSALCFDHLPDEEKSEIAKNGYSKRSSAGGMYKLYSKRIPASELIKEIRKCRVVCCNCHMEQTHKNNDRSVGSMTSSVSLEELEKKLLAFELGNENESQSKIF